MGFPRNKVSINYLLQFFFYCNQLTKSVSDSVQMRKLLGRRPPPREAIVRVVENEVDFQEGVVRIHAPQFRLTEFPVQLNDITTARDVLLR